MGSREIGDPKPGLAEERFARHWRVRSIEPVVTGERRQQSGSPGGVREGLRSRRRPLQGRAVTEAPQGPEDPAEGLSVGFVLHAEHESRDDRVGSFGHGVALQRPDRIAAKPRLLCVLRDVAERPGDHRRGNRGAEVDEGLPFQRRPLAGHEPARDHRLHRRPEGGDIATGTLQGLGRGHHELGHGVDELDQLRVERRRRIGLLNRDRRARRPSVRADRRCPGIHLDAWRQDTGVVAKLAGIPHVTPRGCTSPLELRVEDVLQFAPTGRLGGLGLRPLLPAVTRGQGQGEEEGRCGSQGSMVTRCTRSESWNGSSTSARCIASPVSAFR